MIHTNYKPKLSFQHFQLYAVGKYYYIHIILALLRAPHPGYRVLLHYRHRNLPPHCEVHNLFKLFRLIILLCVLRTRIYICIYILSVLYINIRDARVGRLKFTFFETVSLAITAAEGPPSK